MESLIFLRDNSNLKDIPKTYHTIILKEDYLIYEANQKYTTSYDILIYLRFFKIDYDIVELDTTKPILSKHVIERSKMSERVRKAHENFEKWVDTQ